MEVFQPNIDIDYDDSGEPRRITITSIEPSSPKPHRQRLEEWGRVAFALAKETDVTIPTTALMRARATMLEAHDGVWHISNSSDKSYTANSN